MRVMLFAALLLSVVAANPLAPCYKECDSRLIFDEEDFDVTCNETCKVQKCHEGCDLSMNAISSTCHEVCEAETKAFKKKLSLYCIRGCNIAISLYIESIEEELGTPAQPYLVAETRTNTSITIKWTPAPYKNISYLIQWRYDGSHHSTDWEYYKPFNLLKDNSLKVEDLHPYTKYRFRVAWILLQNYPPLFSEESIVLSTLPYGAPSTSPTITCLTAVSCSKVSVSWDPPTLPNGPILSYVLYIKEAVHPNGNTMIKDVSDTSDGLHYMINNLKSSTTYIISLSTRNAMGEGPADIRNITTLSKKEVSSFHHPPAYLVFAAKQRVLKQGLRILDESQVLYKVFNDSVLVTGIALHVKSNIFFVSDSQGNVHSVSLKGQQRVKTIVSLSEKYPETLSLDWLNGKLYMVEENQISRCDFMGNNYEVIVHNLKSRPEDLHVDPLNGYLYWSVSENINISEGGLYRIDLLEFESGSVPFEKAQLIVKDNQLLAFAVDYKNFRLLLPSAINNTIVSVALDGSDVADIRENSQTPQYKNIKSIAVHEDLLYWTSGSAIFGEEYHKKEDKFYMNVYSVGDGPFLALNIHHTDYQPHPVPLNPVEMVQALFGDNMAKIRWSNPRLLGGQGKGSWQKWLYEVHLLDQNRKLTVFGMNISGDAYDVNNLKPNTTYSVKVRAYSLGGKGPWSTEFVGSTLATNNKRSGFPYILFGAREGLLKSDIVGENAEPLIHKINLNNAHITDVCWYDRMLFINTNTTFVYVYNTSVHPSLTRLQNITMATAIALDWFAPKLYWSSPTQQIISRSNLDGSQPEALPILAMAKEIAIDSVNGFLYWATSHSVERSRLNGVDHFVYMKNALFSGKHVMGITLDFDKKTVYWMVRSYEGSIMYRACLASRLDNSCNPEEPELIGQLFEDGLHGPFWYYSNRLFWLHENQKAFVSDISGNNFAAIEGLGLNGLTSMGIVDPALQPYPDGFDIYSIQVVPTSIPESDIHINGTSDIFNITWNPVRSVNYGIVFYEIRVDDGDEVYSLVTNETVFVYPTMKYLSPYTPLTIAIQAFTHWASAKQTIVILHSPMTVPTKPLHPRIFITHKAFPLQGNQDIIANFRWSPPEKANGIILSYVVTCWFFENQVKVVACNDTVNGKALQFRSHLLPNTTYYFQVQAMTEAGLGPASEIIEAETSIERPIPQLLLAKNDGVKVADIDTHEEKLLYSKATHPAAIAYLAQERRVFWVEEGALMVSSIDGTNTSLIKHLTSEGTCLTVDWVGRKLYWAEVDKKDGYSSVWSLDLSYSSYYPKQIFNKSSVISSLEVEPFSGSLIWTLTSGNSCNLMISDVTGSNIRPFFWRTLEYEASSKLKVKRMTSCNCSPSASVGQAITIDSTNSSFPQILFVDGNHGHIWSSDVEGCLCHMLLNATEISENGLPPTSLTADNTHIYWSNETLGKVYSIKKMSSISEALRLQKVFMSYEKSPIVAEDVRGIRSIRAIGDHLQPYPDATCLLSRIYKETAKLIDRTSSTLTLHLPQIRRPQFCNRISAPTAQFTIFYGPSDDPATQTCFQRLQKNFCKTLTTYNNTVTLHDLRPYTNYSIRVSVTNYYTSEGTPPLGPEIAYLTAEGVPSEPVNVTALAVTPYKIKVYWNPPLYPNGRLISYEVRWKITGSSKNAFTAIHSECGKPSSSDLEMSLKTIDAGKVHIITVRAYSSDCKMYIDSEEVNVTTYSLPNNLTLEDKTSSSLNLSWLSPNEDSVSNHFLEYCQVDEFQCLYTESEEFITPARTIIFKINELFPKTKYNFKLILTYRVQEENFTWPQNGYFQFTTDGDVPSVPGIPELKHMGSDIYKVFWDDSLNHGYEKMIYELQRRSEDLDSDSNDWISVYNDSDTQWIVEGISGNLNYEFRVRAINEYGGSNFSFNEKPFYLPEAGAYIDLVDDPTGIVVASCIGIVVLLTSLFASLYIFRLKREKCKKMLQEVTPSNQLVPDLELATLQDLPLHANFVHQTNALYNLGDSPIDELITLPKIKRDQIIVTKFLGCGAFGEVFEGSLRNELSSMKIAIKTLKKGATDREKEEFLKEAKLMSNFKHRHILQLLGVCFDNNPNFIILELMEGGDLLSYLRSNRPTVFEVSNLTMDDLLKICIDVAEGCKYLEDMHYVHRDLAARNCLVSSYDSDQRIVKIGDFGLARDIYKNDYYRKEGEALLPVRWMAPESLVYGVFTSQSDVWAFGVLLWEVITLGQQPYPARSNMEVLYYVRAGGKLDKPENCPDDLHEIMLSCWSYDADNRPTFCYCLHALQELRNKLLSSGIVMPSVYNFNYLSHTNMGAYIGRYESQENDENKLLDQNLDSRSTQSGPPASSEMEPETNAIPVRRSLSWTSAMFESSENQMLSVGRSSCKNQGKQTVNKYLELLGDNEDSDGYQLPLQFNKSRKEAFPAHQKKCDTITANASPSSIQLIDSLTQQVKNSSSLNINAPLSETLNCESCIYEPRETALDASENNSSIVNNINFKLISMEDKTSVSNMSSEEFSSWLEECDNWSLSTASTATCHIESSLEGNRSGAISALSNVSGIDLNYASKSSYC